MRAQTFRFLGPIVVSAAIATASLAAMLPTVGVRTIPSSPMPGDEVTIALSGDWPDSCTPNSSTDIVTTRDGDTFTVAFALPSPAACVSVVTPWTVGVPVGRLDRGTYRVIVTEQSEARPQPAVIGQGQFSLPNPVVYVPGALAGSNPQIWTVVWAHNNGSEDGTVQLLTKWDPSGEHDLTLNEPVTIAAGDGAYLYLHTHPTPWEGVQFLSLSVTPGIVIRSLLQRTQGGDSAGALTLPTFSSLVPAGARTVAGSFRTSHAECPPSGVPRRLNVTLFNAGDAPATFHVVVATRSDGTRQGGSENRTDSDYVVPARSVRQINGVPYDLAVLCAASSWPVSWIEITADQPYLAYASTVRQDAPGILPYEVFPALTGQ